MNICSFQLDSVQNIATETGTKQNLQSCLSFCCLNEYIYSRGTLVVCQQLFIFVGPVAIDCFILTWGSVFFLHGSLERDIVSLKGLNYPAEGPNLLFLKLIYFNWRLITLQYCGGFCHTLT